MYLYRISYHTSHINFCGTEVRATSTSKYLIYMHVVATLDVQGIFMLYVMCVLSGVNCNAHIPRYKILQPSGQYSYQYLEVSVPYLSPETSCIILFLNFSMQMPVEHLKLFHSFCLYPFLFVINSFNRLYDFTQTPGCVYSMQVARNHCLLCKHVQKCVLVYKNRKFSILMC